MLTVVKDAPKATFYEIVLSVMTIKGVGA